MSKVTRTTKFKKISFHIICVLSIACYCINENAINKLVKHKLERFLPDIKYILIWTEVQGLDDEGQKYFLKNQCKYTNCYMTKNKSLFGNIMYFDSILFNVRDLSKDTTIPEYRTPSQKYIFVANDSAAEYSVCDPIYEDFFNWTWSYRIDSTIPYSFITIYNLQNDELGINFKWKRVMKPLDDKRKNQILSKTKAVATFLNRCKSSSKKEIFLKELQNELANFNLTTDVYGECGSLQCNKRSMKSCYYRLKRGYYFYLAMEDYIAVDYVTNKVLYGYEHDAVPIVFGGANYMKFLPPNSYLDGRKLGARTVAEKINEAMKNATAYFEYFRWKNHYIVKQSESLNACALCEAMNNPQWMLQTVSYLSFRKWWDPSYKKSCNKYKDI